MNLVLINVKDHQLFCHIILRGLPYEVAFYLSPNIALRLIIHIYKINNYHNIFRN